MEMREIGAGSNPNFLCLKAQKTNNEIEFGGAEHRIENRDRFFNSMDYGKEMGI